MDKVLVVGAGFTAALVYSYCKSSDIEVISPSGPNAFINNHISNVGDLMANKAFGVKASSLASLGVSSLSNIKLHHRTIVGGNSTIWGGFYDCDLNFDPSLALESIGAKLVPLSYKSTGSISNKSSFFQLQDSSANVYSAAKFFSNVKIGNYFCKKITSIDKRVSVELISIENGESLIKEYDRIFFCSGVYDAISIIKTSFDAAFFELTDFEHSLKFRLATNKIRYYDDAVIRYDLPRAINHYLGIQKASILSGIKTPFYIDQIFSRNKIHLNIEIKNDIAYLASDAIKFGDSIHYNNLKVNGVKLNEFINLRTQQIVFFGMAALEQLKPGPISSDIHSHIHNYFYKFN